MALSPNSDLMPANPVYKTPSASSTHNPPPMRLAAPDGLDVELIRTESLVQSFDRSMESKESARAELEYRDLDN